MEIRTLRPEDLPKLAVLLDDFQTALGLNIPPDLATIQRNFRLYQSTGNAILLVAVEGETLCGTVAALGYPYPLNDAYLVGDELFWWVAPEHRGGRVGVQLALAVEREAKARGWYALSMCAALGSDSCEAVERFYRRRGFVESDHKFWKEL